MCPEKIPDDELHTLKPEKSIPNQDLNPHSSIGSRNVLGRQMMLAITSWHHRVSDRSSWVHLHLHLGFVHPLQDVALHQCLPLSSVCCFPNPGGSLLLCYVILPSSAWTSSGPLPSPCLPLCASPCPPIVL